MSPHQLIRHSNQELDSLILRRPSRVVTPIIAIDAASINRDQIFSVFLDNYFPTVYSGSPHGVELWHSLVEGFFLLPKKTHMLDTAITALSCVYLGKIKNDGRVFGHGLQLYTQAIQDMSSMICQNIYTDDIICTSVIFQEIEVISHFNQQTFIENYPLISLRVGRSELPLSTRLSNVASPRSRNECNHEASPIHKINKSNCGCYL